MWRDNDTADPGKALLVINGRTSAWVEPVPTIDITEPAPDSISTSNPTLESDIARFEVERTSTKEKSFVDQQIQQSIQQSKKRSADDNRDKLDKLGKRLAGSSNEKSVDDISAFMEGITGSKRATAPNANGGGQPFDPSTAQIHDVRKEIDENNAVRYVVVMVDAKGETAETLIDAETGENLYRTMQLIKANPLLERVYRQMVMGMLDQLLPTSPPDELPN